MITFTMIKPDAVSSLKSGKIIDMIEQNGFIISKMKKKTMSVKMAKEFYSDHKDKSFFNELINFMTSGPVIAMVLKKDYKDDSDYRFKDFDPTIIIEFRALIGDTNPLNAKEGTIRKLFAESMSKNAIHGSDSIENAIKESSIFFKSI